MRKLYTVGVDVNPRDRWLFDSIRHRNPATRFRRMRILYTAGVGVSRWDKWLFDSIHRRSPDPRFRRMRILCTSGGDVPLWDRSLSEGMLYSRLWASPHYNRYTFRIADVDVRSDNMYMNM